MCTIRFSLGDSCIELLHRAPLYGWHVDAFILEEHIAAAVGSARILMRYNMQCIMHYIRLSAKADGYLTSLNCLPHGKQQLTEK